jgi:error-prone DNA polymerase
MRFCRERGIPAQGRGSAGDSIVAYVLGITRVDPIRHRLLFERFINEGRTTYPDVDIDFATSRREEVIQYCYERYGSEHTGMVCNLVTYRARSAVREVGYALGFPRPLVDRVAKALETYDSVMVRRDLEAEGGFAEFFAPSGEGPEPAGEGGEPSGEGAESAGEGGEPAGATSRLAEARGMLDGMGRLRAPSPPWERWLELTARIAEFPRHLSIHTGGMLITAGAAGRHRAARAGDDARPCRGPIRQTRHRDDQADQARPARACACSARSTTRCATSRRLRRSRRPRPPARGHPRGLRDDLAADTVGVFQIESRAQMQTLPRSRPQNLDDLVVEVAIIRPGPIQGNAVHPYLRRRRARSR